MTATAKLFVVLGAVNGALVVALGAFGAHGLKSRLAAEAMATYQTGVQYHAWHALALIAIGLAAAQMGESGLIKWAGWLMLGGIVLFSGSLYVLTLTGARGLGAITPLGGLAFIAGWLLLAAAVWRA